MKDVAQIEALLPQTQCRECGFQGCRPYAEAMLQGKATIDKCPPGGEVVLRQLADAFEIDAEPYLVGLSERYRPPSLAVIDELRCIGCTKCIQACPVDAIVGAPKLMHSVLPGDCTGCGLCVEPCPVDCIDMRELPIQEYEPSRAKIQFEARIQRQLREEAQKAKRFQEKRLLAKQALPNSEQDKQAKQAYIAEALARVAAKKKNHE